MNSDRLIARRRRPAFDRMESRQLLAAFAMVDNPRVAEGTGGSAVMTFTVKLVLPSTTNVSVDYGTADRAATAGSDYVGTSGTLTFAPGETIKQVQVPINSDAIPEPNESFVLNLSKPVNAVIFAGIGTGVIVDDDVPVAPALTISDVQMMRGLSGSRTALFTISLNAAQAAPVSLLASTSNLTALAGSDYVAKAELLTFAPGETVKTFAVTIFGTSTTPTDKIFMVKLSNTTASITRSTAYGILRYGN